VWRASGGFQLQDGDKKQTSLAPQSIAQMEMGGTDLVLVPQEKDAQLVLLTGVPIDEPIANQGPFVMNTQAEINQAMVDYRAGRMGR